MIVLMIPLVSNYRYLNCISYIWLKVCSVVYFEKHSRLKEPVPTTIFSPSPNVFRLIKRAAQDINIDFNSRNDSSALFYSDICTKLILKLMLIKLMRWSNKYSTSIRFPISFTSSTWPRTRGKKLVLAYSTLTNLVEVTVDGAKIQVPSGFTIMQACAQAGVDIPRFCYHERLAIAGNCRMCLVQINGGSKLQASCAMPVIPDAVIVTDCDAVRKGREAVMEFLLANHPLDCPICDQGGECDLQDQAMAFGSDRSRFVFSVGSKRAVEDKALGPIVKTSMNRCIHCTRCVRFANEIAGISDLGTAGRGGSMEIGTYVEALLDNNLSGNIIDLCPVGALTSRPYAFQARPWELRNVDSVDVMDGIGASVRIHTRGMQVMRVTPLTNDFVNEEWISDKSRYSYDALRVQRLVNPLIRDLNGDLRKISWQEALQVVIDQVEKAGITNSCAVVGHFADAESIFLAQKIFQKVTFDRSNTDAAIEGNILREMRLHTGLVGMESADALVIVGTNIQDEAPLLNARIRKGWLKNGTKIFIAGIKPKDEKMYKYEWLGEDCRAIENIDLSPFKRPAIIVGQKGIFNDSCGSKFILDATIKLSKKYSAAIFQSESDTFWCGLNFLPLDCSRTAALQLGCTPSSVRDLVNSKFIYLLNVDDTSFLEELDDDFAGEGKKSKPFIVYQGHHGEAGASLADLILPGAAYTEKDATFVNMEGRIRRTRAAVPPPKDSREDWSILAAISEMMGKPLGYQSNRQIEPPLPGFSRESRLKGLMNLRDAVFKYDYLKTGVDGSIKVSKAIDDYYRTDVISRLSKTMSECSKAYVR